MRKNRYGTSRNLSAPVLLAGCLLLAACGKGGANETAATPQVDTRPITPPPAEVPATPRPAPSPSTVNEPLPPNADQPLDVPDPSGN